MGIYKAPSISENSVMPFVYTCPDPKTIMNRKDRLFVFANYEELKAAEAQLKLTFTNEGRNSSRLGK
jgi:hypothetical protein